MTAWLSLGIVKTVCLHDFPRDCHLAWQRTQGTDSPGDFAKFSNWTGNRSDAQKNRGGPKSWILTKTKEKFKNH